jgi:uncharacterized BrkB/YihY/UPF0761 family membrane protein
MSKIEITITILIGLIAIVVSYLMILLQEYFKLKPSSLEEIELQIVLVLSVYILLMFLIVTVLWRGSERMKKKAKKK